MALPAAAGLPCIRWPCHVLSSHVARLHSVDGTWTTFWRCFTINKKQDKTRQDKTRQQRRNGCTWRGKKRFWGQFHVKDWCFNQVGSCTYIYPIYIYIYIYTYNIIQYIYPYIHIIYIYIFVHIIHIYIYIHILFIYSNVMSIST